MIITEDKNSPLFAISNAHQCKILIHEANIGGRYSVFSNVGMVPSIIAGLNVKLIHDGALDIISKGDDYSQYLKIAQYFRFQRMNPNLSNNIIFTYSDALYNFGKWYLQLWAESIGKNGRGITPIHAIGTTDQHSQLQLYLDGPKDKFFTFVTTNHKGKGLSLHRKTMEENHINYLADKKMGDLMQAEQQATIDTFKNNNFVLEYFFSFIILNVLGISNEFFISVSITIIVSSIIFLIFNIFSKREVKGFNLYGGSINIVETGRFVSKFFIKEMSISFIMYSFFLQIELQFLDNIFITSVSFS